MYQKARVAMIYGERNDTIARKERKVSSNMKTTLFVTYIKVIVV